MQNHNLKRNNFGFYEFINQETNNIHSFRNICQENFK